MAGITNCFSCFPIPFQTDESAFLNQPLKVERKDESSSLLGRIDCDWRYVPVLVTLCTCIIGIVAAIFVFSQPYFSIMFAFGAVGSMISLYFVHQMRDLQSFKENNIQFAQTAHKLQTELETAKKTALELEKTKGELEEQNEKLQASVQTFGDQLATLGEENENLKVTEENLRASEEQLKADLVEMGKKLEKVNALFDVQNDQIAKLNKAITELGKRSEQQRTFNLAFSQTKDEFNKTLGNFNQTYENGQQAINEVVDNLTTVFEQQDKHIQKLHNLDKVLEERNKQYVHVTKQWVDMEAKISRLKGAFDEIQKLYESRVQALEEIEKKFHRNTTIYAENNEAFATHLDRLSTVTNQFHKRTPKHSYDGTQGTLDMKPKYNTNNTDTDTADVIFVGTNE